jgi:cation diffusion facilitator family transporter
MQVFGKREEDGVMERHLKIPIYLSILAGVVTLGLKTAAWWLTGSVGLLSDAAESIVNLLAAVTAALSLAYAARPVDRDHTYGHEKIEFFSSGLEGVLILVAAVTIGWTAVLRLLSPQPLETLGLGLAISLAAAVINGVVGVILLRAGRKHRSIVLEADGKHLLTDVWTSIGVLAALTLVWATGWQWLDPVIALLVAVNILWTAWGLIRKSFDGLMDHALPEQDQKAARKAIEAHLGPDMAFHAMRTRQAGSRRFLDFHLLVPGEYSVRRAHALGEAIETSVKECLPGSEVTVHIEPIDEPGSWKDSALLAVERNSEPANNG